jgi:hypothetical protein
MSLTTPSKIRELQIKLYRKAKNEPEYRFYMLYDKIYRDDICCMPTNGRAPTRALRAWMSRRLSRSSRQVWRSG